MGKVISFLAREGKTQSHTAQFLQGVVTALVTLILFVAPVYFILLYVEGIGTAAYVIAGALLLKPAFAFRELLRTALKIKRFLVEDKLDEARFELRALVSRDTRSLSKPQLVSATVESVAESTCDSFISPLFYFLLFGVPGAIAYRAVNTMDSMIGYHGKYEYLGKFPSKLDDVLNFVPARLTALLLILAALLSGKDGRSSWQVTLEEHSKTESPNAGWPIAAVAGALNVQLEKVKHYKLGKADNLLKPETIDASLRLAQITALTWVSISIVGGVIYYVVTS
jgi:adenosylcobinamide-phosphate synthase